MMRTVTKLLGEICDIKIGRTPPRKEKQWFNTGICDWQWVSIRDMGECGRLIRHTTETISQVAQQRFNIPIVKKGTILLSFKLTIGRLAICDGDMVTNEAIAQLPIIDTAVDRDFLYYFLKSHDFSKLGSTSSIATAINSKMIRSIPVVIPEIEIQRKIANELSYIDSKIDSNSRTNDNLRYILYQPSFVA